MPFPAIKKYFIPLIPLLFLLSCRPYTKISGTYYTEQQDALMIDDEKGLLETYGEATVTGLRVKQNRNRILFKWNHSGPIPVIQHRVDRYRFRILTGTEDSLLLSPASALSKRYFKDRDSIVFKPEYRFLDKFIRWEKIIFHSSHCYGLCPDYSLQIERDGQIKLTNRGSSFKPALNDHYQGILSTDQLDNLNRLLSLSHLNTLQWAPRLCCDGPVYSIILYYNNKRLYLHAMWTPVVSRKLVNFLEAQFRNKSLEKVDSVFSYER